MRASGTVGAVVVEVRAAGPDDVLPACRARVASWRAGYAGRAPQDVLDALDPEADAARWGPWVAEHPDRLFVVLRGGEVFGQALWGPEEVDGAASADLARIHQFYVHPAAWRGGLGSALMAGLLDLLGGNGFREVNLWVLEDNPRARPFYERHGFTWTGDAVPAHFPGHRELRYLRALP